MGSLLGGSASPLGWCVQYLHAPADVVLAEIETARAEWNHTVRVRRVGPLADSLASLLPFQAPWTREVVLDCGEWTAYLNNFVDGGDPTAIGAALMDRLGVGLVVAQHSPRHGPGHQATQLWVQGPDGEPPGMYRRTIAAHCQDGRWSWHESGTPYDFEDTARYAGRLIRSRLDRALLISYLERFGIRADDDAFYGSGVAVEQVVSYPSRTVTLDEARAELVVRRT